MEILGYAMAILVGIIMGMMGSGGSILCVPIFVYILGYDTTEATSFSLFVVGIVSLIGATIQFKNKNIDLKNALSFGIPSIISVIVIRKFLVPNLPEIFYHTSLFTIRRDMAILVLFATLMIMSAYKMIKNNSRITQIPKTTPQNQLLVAQGLGIGLITGLIGAGGGFLIVPALVIILGMEIKKAIATSLLIVGLNSSFGFLVSIDLVEIPWPNILLFLLFALIGLAIGLYLNKKINTKNLKPAFGWFILTIGIFIIVKESINGIL